MARYKADPVGFKLSISVGTDSPNVDSALDATRLKVGKGSDGGNTPYTGGSYMSLLGARSSAIVRAFQSAGIPRQNIDVDINYDSRVVQLDY